ncbi:uncharacterized protein LOC143044803 [Mytilus galloprovincialis]|uniref:uncharacterized protein LOC143044803 n=1 Tax=Mytilus galloprovincialis TaxID=29158 RepID=UPI003F7BFA60
MDVPVAELIIDGSVNKAQVATGNVISQKTYFARLGHATYNLIPNMIRELLAHFIHPNILHKTIPTRDLRYFNLADTQKINEIRDTGYRGLDLTLMYRLIKMYVPSIQTSGAWGNLDNIQGHNVSLGDDIERCRIIRNSITHRSNTTVSYQELNDYFSVFKDVARRFEKVLGKEPNAFVSQFEVLEKCSMDEDI